jgi:hypothetical protein
MSPHSLLSVVINTSVSLQHHFRHPTRPSQQSTPLVSASVLIDRLSLLHSSATHSACILFHNISASAVSWCSEPIPLFSTHSNSDVSSYVRVRRPAYIPTFDILSIALRVAPVRLLFCYLSFFPKLCILAKIRRPSCGLVFILCTRTLSFHSPSIPTASLNTDTRC